MTLAPGLEAAIHLHRDQGRHRRGGGQRGGAGAGYPRVLALAERATVAAVAGVLEVGSTTVGTRWS
jgi:fluoroacetyl-CoA thioesterase